MRVLLAYPEFPDTFWSFKYALRFVRKKASNPPLGLLTVAAMLPRTWEKRLVDLNVRDLTVPDLAWADLVFVSAMQVQRDSTRRLIARCKQAGVRVVAGGPLFTCGPERFEGVDHYVLNEAELTLPPFLADLERGVAKPVYSSSEFADLSLTPVPEWGLLDLDRYASMSLQYSRGCPYSCDFCNVTVLFGHRPRTKSAAQVQAELESLYAVGWRGSVFFVDDNFIGNRRELKEQVLPALIAWRQRRKGLPFNTEVTINLADDEELLDQMVRAGFDSVFIGIETPDENALAECHKSQNKGRDLTESVRRIQRRGLRVQAGFIVGFDSDTPSIFQRQIEFIQRSGIVTAMVGLLQAPYGTKLYQRLSREGRLRGAPSGDNVDGGTNIVPRMELSTLREGYKRILTEIYSPKKFYDRIRTFLQEYRLPQASAPLEFEHLLAFARSIYQLGIRGVERVQYWKLFFWALLRRPRMFPLAITLSIYGFHFRKVCEQHVQ
jgi:radical SAM superfamily enzyme YgiQ (UPF0313 family)